MPLLETRGAGSAKGFGLTGSTGPVNYIEDVFSTTLYSGTNAYRGLFLGVPNLAERGALFWFKSRNSAVDNDNKLYDTARMGDGGSFLLGSPSLSSNLTGFNNSGANFFVVKNRTDGYVEFGGSGGPNESGVNYVGWTFRKQPKFFDVVTYTGTGSARNVAHNLGSVPGCIIVKCTSQSNYWPVYHRSLGDDNGFPKFLRLESTSVSQFGSSTIFRSTPTSTSFELGADAAVNASGQSYVAYLFAHDAGGFGLTGTDNVISCGSFTTDGSGNATVNLGWEPQWVLVKATDLPYSWEIYDTMRGIGASGTDHRFLLANTNGTEGTSTGMSVNSTGFAVGNNYWGPSVAMAYIAIRRGPMRTPTTGARVFMPIAQNQPAGTLTTVGFAADAILARPRGSTASNVMQTRLIGYATANNTNAQSLITNTTGAENGASATYYNVWNSTAQIGNAISSTNSISWMFGRAPGVFDVVCYTGNNVYGAAQRHNLGVVPELIIVKQRSGFSNWAVGCNFTSTEFQFLSLNSGADGGNTNAYTSGGFFGARPTATNFFLAQNSTTNGNGGTYVAYLFATLAGVSKVGTYAGTGTTQQINCGFTGGARFVLIKRLGTSTDAGVGDWYVWDAARGIVAADDPYLLLNSTAAEVTNTDFIDTFSSGFEISSTAPAAINANGGTFLFLAIA